MSRSIELPDDLYLDLEQIAGSRGMTPLDWIAATVPTRAERVSGTLLSDSLEGLVGTIDSSEETGSPRQPSRLTELIASKLGRQGLTRQ